MEDKKEKLFKFVQDFIEKNEVHCEEDYYQSDRLIEIGMEFMDRCCSIVGFKELKD